MNILSFMNVSNRQFLETDSGYVFYNILSNYFSQNGNHFTFAGPAPLHSHSTHHIPMELGKNKYEARFSFPWNKISQIFKDESPDIVLVNQIELLSNYRAVIESTKAKAKLIGYAHYIPFGVDANSKIFIDTSLNAFHLYESILLNFLSGLQAADLIFVHSKTALDFIAALYRYFSVAFPEDRFEIIPPPRDPYLIDHPNHRCSSTIVYNHRLYKHYGTQFLLNLATLLSQKITATINVLDILGSRTLERKQLDDSVDILKEQLQAMPSVHVTNNGLNRYSYKGELLKARCILAPYRLACTWSMSCIDSMGMGIPVIAPDIAWFKEIIPADLRFKTLEEAVTIIEKIMKDDEYWNQKSLEVRAQTTTLAPEIIAKKILNKFYSLM